MDVRSGPAREIRAAFAACLMLGVGAAHGHHSVSMYDNDNLITVEGTVTRVEWTSPHVFIYLAAVAADGTTAEWSVELDPPVLLRRYGWRQSTVQAGDALSLTGAPAKSGATVMRGAIAELADGTELRVWSRV
jgi:hypothetical protein